MLSWASAIPAPLSEIQANSAKAKLTIKNAGTLAAFLEAHFEQSMFSPYDNVPLNVPYTGSVDIGLEVLRGNPVDVFVAASTELDAIKKGDWNNVNVYADFNALKSKTYRRTGQLGQGSYYLVIRDTSFGILSASASDISVKVRLSP